tara:strand:+ start:5894 stop:6070 length:177 start_codon:yes stop_codon:yes gene_type:complete
MRNSKKPESKISKELKGRFAIVNFYRDLLKKGIIKIGGAAHKRMNQLKVRNYEQATEN